MKNIKSADIIFFYTYTANDELVRKPLKEHGRVFAVSSQTKHQSTPIYEIRTQIFLSIEGRIKSYLALVDAGVTHSLLKKELWDTIELTPFLSTDSTTTLLSIAGEAINTIGEVTIPASINGKTLKNCEFCVVAVIINETNILAEEGVRIDFQKKRISGKRKKSTFTITEKNSKYLRLLGSVFNNHNQHVAVSLHP